MANYGDFAEIEFISRPEVRLIDDLVGYWNRKRAGRIGPRLVDIDPAEIKSHLPHIVLLDVVDDGADFLYRMVGTNIVKGLGRDNTGKRISELYADRPEARAWLHARFKRAVDEKVPLFTRGRVFWVKDGLYRRYTSCSLPLSDDGVTVNAILFELFVQQNGHAEVSSDPHDHGRVARAFEE